MTLLWWLAALCGVAVLALAIVWILCVAYWKDDHQ